MAWTANVPRHLTHGVNPCVEDPITVENVSYRVYVI